MKAYPRGFVTLLWWVFAFLTVSGILLIPNMLEMRLHWSIALALPSGSRVWIALAHALGAFATLIVMGALLPLHIRYGLRRRIHLKSGLILTSIFVGLPLTALGIYYFGDDAWSAWSSIVHLVLASAAVLALIAHVVLAKRLQARRTAARALDMTVVIRNEYARSRPSSHQSRAGRRRRA